MDRAIIVSDVHEDFNKLVSVTNKYHGEQFTFLGDFMDSFKGLTEDTTNTLKWLADNMDNPNYTFLWGNHDLHYAAPVSSIIGSGFDNRKHKLWVDILGPSPKGVFRLYCWENKWLVSHAGLAKMFLPKSGSIEYLDEHLEDLERKAIRGLFNESFATSFVSAGRGRGGFNPSGGITWLDWTSEFTPIPGLNQIVGHSRGKDIRKKEAKDSVNYCIDCDMKFNAIVNRETGEISFEENV